MKADCSAMSKGGANPRLVPSHTKVIRRRMRISSLALQQSRLRFRKWNDDLMSLVDTGSGKAVLSKNPQELKSGFSNTVHRGERVFLTPIEGRYDQAGLGHFFHLPFEV